MIEFFEDAINESKWRFLLDYVHHRADIFVVATSYNRPSLFKKKKPFPKYLQPISDSLIDVTTSRERWHCRQLFRSDFYRFKITDQVWNFIEELPDLRSWGLWSNYPEDPSFYMGDIPLVETISHEGYAYVYVDEADILKFKQAGFKMIRDG